MNFPRGARRKSQRTHSPSHRGNAGYHTVSWGVILPSGWEIHGLTFEQADKIAGRRGVAFSEA
jgi:hypothetical protein